MKILKVKLPHPVEVALPNGLTMLVLEQHRLPTVYYSLWIKSGALSDPKDAPGLASFTADLLRDGTAKRNSTQIATELDELGATFNADAAFGSNVTTCSGFRSQPVRRQADGHHERHRAQSQLPR